MTERRPRFWRKEKLSESGKPERKMPLSTIAKFKGGMKLISSPATGGDKIEEAGESEKSRWSTIATSIVLHISPSVVAPVALWWLWSTFMREKMLERESKKREEDLGERERGRNWESRGMFS